jgi:23S rRNA (pseudouridine1915-N3)-methyltransferase
MMKIDIICVGKLKEKYLIAAVAEYTKRLSKYCKMEIKEVADEKAPEKLSDKQEIDLKNKEGEGILKYIKEGAYVIALAIEGKMQSSEELAKNIADLGVKGKSHIVFIIGGSLGLSEEVLKRADEKMSFSKMTFPHQLVRVILLEQVYRCFRINNNEPYHK